MPILLCTRHILFFSEPRNSTRFGWVDEKEWGKGLPILPSHRYASATFVKLSVGAAGEVCEEIGASLMKGRTFGLPLIARSELK